MTAQEKLTKARAGLVLDNPFFGSLALSLKWKLDETAKTGYTDGHAIGYSTKFIDGLTIAQVKGFIAHEVMHCACAHQARRQSRQPRKFNVAADYAINGILQNSGFTLPAGALLDPQYSGMTAEQIYTKIPDSPEGDGGDSDPGNCGEVRDDPGNNGKGGNGHPTPSELAQAEADWKIKTTQAAQQAKAMGKLPADLADLVGELTAPRIDWRDALRRFVSMNARNDYSWQKPNRRYVAQGIYLPGLHSESLKPIVVHIDTSGSTWSDQGKFLSEVNAIVAELPISSVHVIYCDAAINKVNVYGPGDAISHETHGGGGTDFRPIFEHVAGMEEQPECLVSFTDAEGPYPDDAPDYPVISVVLGKADVPFGEVIRYE